ncbi:hypothetical protein RRG08_044317 [Elysia crispata]|uniref:Uncharacterized protein n=1 Tax=Elysia crispata TaxID=231223 RepID=A0AAE0ZB86_9GAST|nr:hypothetical protein RRG08_044317 [Elysia crispata]
MSSCWWCYIDLSALTTYRMHHVAPSVNHGQSIVYHVQHLARPFCLADHLSSGHHTRESLGEESEGSKESARTHTGAHRSQREHTLELIGVSENTHWSSFATSSLVRSLTWHRSQREHTLELIRHSVSCKKLNLA